MEYVQEPCSQYISLAGLVCESCRNAAEALFLLRARFEVTVAAEADKNLGFVWLFYPMAVLLESLVGALELGISARLNRLYLCNRLYHFLHSRWLYFFNLFLHKGVTLR